MHGSSYCAALTSCKLQNPDRKLRTGLTGACVQVCLLHNSSHAVGLQRSHVVIQLLLAMAEVDAVSGRDRGTGQRGVALRGRYDDPPAPSELSFAA